MNRKKKNKHCVEHKGNNAKGQLNSPDHSKLTYTAEVITTTLSWWSFRILHASNYKSPTYFNAHAYSVSATLSLSPARSRSALIACVHHTIITIT